MNNVAYSLKSVIVGGWSVVINHSTSLKFLLQ